MANIHKTSFDDHFIVWLDGQKTDDDLWKLSNEVTTLIIEKRHVGIIRVKTASPH